MFWSFTTCPPQHTTTTTRPPVRRAEYTRCSRTGWGMANGKGITQLLFTLPQRSLIASQKGSRLPSALKNPESERQRHITRTQQPSKPEAPARNAHPRLSALMRSDATTRKPTQTTVRACARRMRLPSLTTRILNIFLTNDSQFP